MTGEKVSCPTINYGTLFQMKLEKANPYHAFKTKLLLIVFKCSHVITLYYDRITFVNNYSTTSESINLHYNLLLFVLFVNNFVAFIISVISLSHWNLIPIVSHQISSQHGGMVSGRSAIAKHRLVHSQNKHRFLFVCQKCLTV